MANLDSAYKRRMASCVTPRPNGDVSRNDRRQVACIYGITLYTRSSGGSILPRVIRRTSNG